LAFFRHFRRALAECFRLHFFSAAARWEVPPAPLELPVPVRATVWGLPLAGSVIDNVPVRIPAPVGANATASWQEPAGATAGPLQRSEVIRKSPLAEIEEIASTRPDVFPRLMVCGEPTVPGVWEPNETDPGWQGPCVVGSVSQ